MIFRQGAHHSQPLQVNRKPGRRVYAVPVLWLGRPLAVAAAQAAQQQASTPDEQLAAQVRIIGAQVTLGVAVAEHRQPPPSHALCYGALAYAAAAAAAAPVLTVSPATTAADRAGLLLWTPGPGRVAGRPGC